MFSSLEKDKMACSGGQSVSNFYICIIDFIIHNYVSTGVFINRIFCTEICSSMIFNNIAVLVYNLRWKFWSSSCYFYKGRIYSIHVNLFILCSWLTMPYLLIYSFMWRPWIFPIVKLQVQCYFATFLVWHFSICIIKFVYCRFIRFSSVLVLVLVRVSLKYQI